MRIYNTLTREKEEFRPINKGKVGMYVCGITVYDRCHIGHARSTVIFDIIFRYLQNKGYDVTYVRNFTDVDDKIINKANDEGKTCEEVADANIAAFHEDMDRLGVLRPTIEPRATEHINEMIKLVKDLLSKGVAYEAEGDVYFDVAAFPSYGKLSGRNLDEMQAGARVEVNKAKKNPLDFVLWKSSKPKEPSWQSPWGEGRPGWHLECSAMGVKYLGQPFDIHGGGRDLIFPHHENEIAQSEAANDSSLANYWVHNGFVSINQEKMSKSLGNFFTIEDVLKEYDPEILRIFLLTKHYRSPVDFSRDNMESAKSSLLRIYTAIARAEALNSEPDSSTADPDLDAHVNSFMESCEDAMDDDFNTPKVLALCFDLVRSMNRCMDGDFIAASTSLLNEAVLLLRRTGEYLGLFQMPALAFIDSFKDIKNSGVELSEDDINALIDERANAREAKNWERSDEIREQLLQKGITLKDTPDGTTWEIKGAN